MRDSWCRQQFSDKCMVANSPCFCSSMSSCGWRRKEEPSSLSEDRGGKRAELRMPPRYRSDPAVLEAEQNSGNPEQGPKVSEHFPHQHFPHKLPGSRGPFFTDFLFRSGRQEGISPFIEGPLTTLRTCSSSPPKPSK